MKQEAMRGTIVLHVMVACTSMIIILVAALFLVFKMMTQTQWLISLGAICAQVISIVMGGACIQNTIDAGYREEILPVTAKWNPNIGAGFGNAQSLWCLIGFWLLLYTMYSLMP